jgi:WD40 repeat protein
LYIWELDGVVPRRLLTTNDSGAFTPDGRRFLTFGSNREVITLDVATGATVEPPIPTQLVNGPQKPQVTWSTLILSPDGTRLAMASGDRVSVEIWNWNTHRLLYSLPKQEGILSVIKWSPDNQRLAVGHAENATAIWNLKEVEQTLAKLGLKP